MALYFPDKIVLLPGGKVFDGSMPLIDGIYQIGEWILRVQDGVPEWRDDAVWDDARIVEYSGRRCILPTRTHNADEVCFDGTSFHLDNLGYTESATRHVLIPVTDENVIRTKVADLSHSITALYNLQKRKTPEPGVYFPGELQSLYDDGFCYGNTPIAAGIYETDCCNIVKIEFGEEVKASQLVDADWISLSTHRFGECVCILPLGADTIYLTDRVFTTSPRADTTYRRYRGLIKITASFNEESAAESIHCKAGKLLKLLQKYLTK